MTVKMDWSFVKVGASSVLSLIIFFLSLFLKATWMLLPQNWCTHIKNAHAKCVINSHSAKLGGYCFEVNSISHVGNISHYEVFRTERAVYCYCVVVIMKAILRLSRLRDSNGRSIVYNITDTYLWFVMGKSGNLTYCFTILHAICCAFKLQPFDKCQIGRN